MVSRGQHGRAALQFLNNDRGGRSRKGQKKSHQSNHDALTLGDSFSSTMEMRSSVHTSGRGYIVRVGDAQIRAERDTDDVSNLCSFRKASAARSPMMMQGAMVFPVVTRGMIEPSAMRRFSIP